jgi:hypothetical protein
VWLLTPGGAIFAAFPHWYATLFSGFYLALFLILQALILRGVAFEFRSKDENPTWRKLWDVAIFAGSRLPAVLLTVAFVGFCVVETDLFVNANLVQGAGLAAGRSHGQSGPHHGRPRPARRPGCRRRSHRGADDALSGVGCRSPF